jgi:hypothetical protein
MMASAQRTPMSFFIYSPVSLRFKMIPRASVESRLLLIPVCAGTSGGDLL